MGTGINIDRLKSYFYKQHAPFPTRDFLAKAFAAAQESVDVDVPGALATPQGQAAVAGAFSDVTPAAADKVIGATGKALIGDWQDNYAIDTAGGAVRKHRAKAQDIPDVRDWGASPSRSDNQVPINAAIAYLAANSSGGAPGGVLQLPRALASLKITAPIVAKGGVRLVGGQHGFLPQRAQGCRIYADSSFSGAAMVTDDLTLGTPGAVLVDGFGLAGLELYGLGAVSTLDGVLLSNARKANIKSLSIMNMGGRGVALVNGGAACHLENLFMYQALMNQAAVVSGGVDTGSLHLEGVDHEVSRLEVGCSIGVISDSNLHAAAFHLAASKCRITGNIVCQLSDIGLRVAGHFNIISGVRCDRNWGHGVLLSGSANLLDGVMAISNGQGADNTYSNFRIGGSKNLLANCPSEWDSSTDPNAQPKYDYEDLAQASSIPDRNRFVNCVPRAGKTSPYKFNVGLAPSIALHDGIWEQQAPVNSINLSQRSKNMALINTVAHNLSICYGAADGQEFNFLCDGFTTFVHTAYSNLSSNSGIVLLGGSNLTPAAGTILKFRCRYNQLVQV